MGGLDGGDDALHPCQILKGVHSLVVGDGHILRTTHVVEVGVLGANAGIVQTCTDGVHGGDLTVLVLAEVGLHAVEDAYASGCHGGGSLKGVDAPTGGLAADEADILVPDEVVEGADGVGAAAHTGDDGIGQSALFFQDLLLDLLGDDSLEVPHHLGEGMGTHGGADAVVGVMDAAGPLDHGLVDGILQSGGAALDGNHLRAQQPHPVDIQRLTDGVLLAHEDHALQTHQGGGGGGGDTVLTGAGLGDDALLAHLLGQQGLTEHIVDLVGAGVVQVLALEIDLRAAQILRHLLGVVKPRRTACVVIQQLAELPVELRIVLIVLISGLQLRDGVHQDLGDILTAVDAESSFFVHVSSSLHSGL